MTRKRPRFFNHGVKRITLRVLSSPYALPRSSLLPLVTFSNVGIVMPIRLTLPTHYHSEPHARARAFAHVQSQRRKKPPAHKFDFPTELIGTAADVTLYYDPQLGQAGADLAQQLKPNVEQTYVNCRNYFAIAGQPVNVIIAPVNNQTDGSGGAYHYGCSFNPGGDLYCDAAFTLVSAVTD